MSNWHTMLGYLVLFAGVNLAHGACRGESSFFEESCRHHRTKRSCLSGPSHGTPDCDAFCCWTDDAGGGGGGDDGWMWLLVICLPLCICGGCGCWIIYQLCCSGSCQTTTGAAFVPQQQTSSAYPQPSMQMMQRPAQQLAMAPTQMTQMPAQQPAMAPMQPALAPQQPIMAPGGNQFQVCVPDGCAGGSSVMVNAPNGQQMQVVVPAGLQAGQNFVAEY